MIQSNLPKFYSKKYNRWFQDLLNQNKGSNNINSNNKNNNSNCNNKMRNLGIIILDFPSK